jgi:sigma-54 dependent transcriptional regulator, acetoin dehydrogenase operon transcriptional activator AcoR
MDKPKHLILFLSESGNNLHLMAECFARNMNRENIGLISASMTPPHINPVARSVMQEVSMDISCLEMNSLLDIELFMFDLVITLGVFDQSCRPTLPGMPPHFHWDVPDPSPETEKSEAAAALRTARDKLKEKVKTLFDSDLLHALFVTRRNLELILDNLPDGVMAHTTNRRIFFFNQAAERITGYRKKNILGKDCHEVFPGKFCGGDCEFCDNSMDWGKKGVTQKEVVFKRPDGQERMLRMSTLPLTDEAGKGMGALLSFKDDTELNLLKRRVKHRHALGGLIGNDPQMLALFDHIREVSSVNAPVLIQGESGTGKELVARTIHKIGPRAKQPFVAINCGALPEGILESELFGHKRGAFSGAVRDRKGRFELADQGTIFLDEVSELSPAMQVKLLRVLQEQRFEPVGGENTIEVNVRVISATNQNIRDMMEKKKFRRDLFYRLCVVPINVPPLRSRRMDIPSLVEHFLEFTAKELERPMLIPSSEAMDFLNRYPWPGNVRELHNAVEYAYVKCHTGIILIEHLPPEIVSLEKSRSTKPGPKLKLKKENVLDALVKAQGNRNKAARILKVGRATLYRYLDVFDLK